MKIQRTITLAIALTLVAFAAVACGNKNAANGNSAAGGSASSPTKTYQTFYEAMKNKDVKALKSVMPKDFLAEGDKRAKEQNKTVDDLLKEGFDRGGMPKMPDTLPDFKNEAIASDGKTATLEVKDPEKGNWEQIHFIKDDDGWKIDFKKMMGR